MLFRERLAHTLARARRTESLFAVLFLDMDRFKAINDGLGHDLGDMFLKEVASRLKEAVREYDTVARFGGDEFAILLDRLDSRDQAKQIAERILSALKYPFSLEGTEFVSSASIGIAIFPHAGDTSDSLFRAADAAMYFAKSRGRANYQVYGAELNESAERRLALEIELRQALDQGDVELNYQPQYDLRSGDVAGVEALLRWKRAPDKASIGPAQFVPILEETGWIVGVGEWVLHEACAQLSRWHRAGYLVPRVAVNVSARQFVSGDLVAATKSALANADLEPQCLELEITEAVLMRNTERTLNVLTALTDLGVSLAIDDFGTGYSSLAYLHAFPVHTLKLDASFMQDLGLNERRSKVAGAIVGLGHRLNLTVVAEGVETIAQRDFLVREGCQVVQGYLFSRPAPAHHLEEAWDASGVYRLSHSGERLRSRAEPEAEHTEAEHAEVEQTGTRPVRALKRAE
jgi:diguanylate cyclase (GGDEF)-like protein